MAQPVPRPEVSFRLRIAPQWEAILPLQQERAKALGMQWPSGLKAARVPRVYALTLAGQHGAHGPVGPVEALLWEPPRERAMQPPFDQVAAVHVPFGVAAKKSFKDANPGHDLPFDALALHLDAEGLMLSAHGELPLVRVAPIPLAAVLGTFYGVAAGTFSLERAGADFIVDKFNSPEELQGLRVSRWRGDASHRLATPTVQMEIWVS